ncbi:MAG: OmpA family protein [Bacteriovorax sp.]|nr:OmpA family protein [Bacteriovorax sp.]
MNPLQPFKKNFFKSFLLIIILTGIVACSSKPVVRDFPPTATPAEEIANLERDLNSAKDKQVDVLSPKNFKEAEASLEDAKKKFLNGKDSQQTLHKVAIGRAYLINANNSAEVARENVQDVINAREAALKAEAPIYFNREFKNADEYFEDVTREIEKNKMTAITKERPKLQQRYLDLELRAIKEKNLKESKDIITQAKKENAEKYAPRTLAIAEKSYTDTEAYIKANPHETLEIKARAKETKDAAYHAFNINRTAKGTSKVSSEEIAILIEQERDRALNNQKKLNSMEDQLETTQSALEKEKETQTSLVQTAEELKAEKEKLEDEKSFDEKYEDARKKFTSNEAEVYRQGDALLIRLKGMEFPSSTATIQSKSYPLLSKVQQVVEEFGTGSEIIIEGHTDSSGAKTINNRLSADRAKAVKEYLQANSGGIEAKIEAVGYGDAKPLATNKTVSGRAQNRRVDIVIKPDTTKL